jgi:hypothetical protein
MRTALHLGLAILLCAMAACGPVGTTSGDPALVGYWKFDDDAGARALDSSGYGNAGLYVHAPEPSADVPPVKFPDPRARAFLQGRGQHVEVADSPSLRLTGSVTVAAWVKPAVERCEDNQGIAERFTWTGTEASGGFTFRLSRERNVMFSVNPASGGGKGCWCQQKAAVGVWSHVAGVYDAPAQEVRVYLNGRQIAVARGIPAPGPTEQPLRLGSDYSQNQFNGSLDDIRLYSRALSEQEIQSLSSGNER